MAKQPQTSAASKSLKSEMQKMNDAVILIKKTKSPHEALLAVLQIRKSAQTSKNLIPNSIKGDKASVGYYKESFDQIIEITKDMEAAIRSDDMLKLKRSLTELSYAKASGHRSFKN